MRNVSDQSWSESQSTRFKFNKFFFFCKYFPLRINEEKYVTARQVTDGDMAHALACWITTATDTHSERVTINDFPLQ
jgi:hypothetical protein